MMLDELARLSSPVFADFQIADGIIFRIRGLKNGIHVDPANNLLSTERWLCLATN